MWEGQIGCWVGENALRASKCDENGAVSSSLFRQQHGHGNMEGLARVMAAGHSRAHQSTRAVRCSVECSKFPTMMPRDQWELLIFLCWCCASDAQVSQNFFYRIVGGCAFGNAAPGSKL